MDHSNVHEWAVSNKIIVIALKSLALLISPKIITLIPDIQLHFNNNSVTLVDFVKYLGITIDARLNFNVAIYCFLKSINEILKLHPKNKKIPKLKTNH